MTLHHLRDARPATSGGKAAALGTLLRAGIDVPAGVVVPVTEYARHLQRAGIDPGVTPPQQVRGAIMAQRLDEDLVQQLEDGLRWGPGEVPGVQAAVRSSATHEDGAAASAAGQHDSFLAVQGTEAVAAAILRCWASLWSEHAVAYRGDAADIGEAPQMAVILQEFLDAEVSGVLFTGEERLLEAVHGGGDQLVGGTLTPDSWRLDDSGIVDRRAGGSTGAGPCLSDRQVRELIELGDRVSRVIGAPSDIEWALVAGRFRILQARPITAALPRPRGHLRIGAPLGSWTGIPASGGSATGTARAVRGPADFRRVRPGDVLICRSTDPAWTPLFRIAGAVVAENGGVLSHAAILARELGIPAVLAVPGAMSAIADGTVVSVDGDAGEIRAVSRRGSLRARPTSRA